jgi:hypothetical protein
MARQNNFAALAHVSSEEIEPPIDVLMLIFSAEGTTLWF